MFFRVICFQVCSKSGFNEQVDWQNHVESEAHCSAMLTKYFSSRPETYAVLYTDVPYSQALDLPVNELEENSPTLADFTDLYVRMMCRSGVLLQFNCKVRV